MSLHRSEGFGLTLAEAMHAGKPTIATAYGGNVDFMDNETSCLIDYKLIELERNFGPYMKGAVWAEPDVEAAAAAMLRLRDVS